MTEEGSAPTDEMEGLLQKLEEAKLALMSAIGEADPEQFASETDSGESLKRVLERTADDVNFYYGRLVARAVSLPQLPCLQTAEFLSLREAAASLQVAHRRFSNLLHDLVPQDLDRLTKDEEHGTYSLRQLLEMAAAHYRLRTEQVRALSSSAREGTR